MNIKVAPLSPTKKLGGFIRIRNDRNGPITLSYRYDQDVLEVFDPPFVDETGAYLSHKRCEVRARALLQELNAIRHVVHCVQEDSPFLVIVCFEKIHCRYRTFWYNVLSDTHQELQTWLSGNTIYSTSMARMPSTVNVNKMRFVLAFGMEDGSARVFSIKTEANCDSSVSIQTAVAMIDNDRSPITAVKVVSESLEDCRAGYKYPKVFLGSMTGFLGFFSIRLEENDLVILSKRILTRACIYRKRPIIHLEARRVHLSIILAIGQGGPKECISDGDRTKQAAVRILRYHGNGSLSVINTMTLRFQRELCDIASIRIYQGPNGLCTTAVFREISFPYGLVIKRTIGADKNQNTQSDTDLPFSPTGVLDFLDVNNDYLLLLEQELVKPETVQDDADIIRVVLNTGAISEMENAHRSSAEVSKPQSAGERPVASATEDNELSASTTAHSIADVSTRDILKGFSMDTSKEITCLKDREAIDECIACDGDDANVDISQADNVDEIVSEKENTDNCLAGNGIVGDDSTDEDVAETDIAYDMVVSDCTSDNEATEWDPEDDEAEDNDTPGNCLSYGEIAEDDITQDIIVSEKAPKHGIADNSTTRDPAIGYDDVDHDIKDNAINVYEFTDISSPDADIADDDTSQEDAYNDNPYNDIPDLIIIDDDGASDHDTVDSDNSDDVIYCNDFDGDIASDNSATGNASHDDDVEMSFLEEQRGIGNTVIDHKDDEYDVDIVYDNGDDLQSDQVSIEDSDIDQHEVYHSTESISDASVPNAIEPSPKVPLSEFADFFNALRESSADGKLFLDLLLSEAYPQYKSDIAYLRINGELILSELAKGTLLDQQSHRQALYYLCLLNVDCHLDASLFTFMKEEEQNLVTSYTQFDRGYWEASP
ncbi:hypothetical protein BX666DRAFT_1961796 [Dichotomocladium elegans]|nr:hypothetical protein BX666DRAFT_1961796 [Dichotomocladium elegans]